MVLFEPMKKRLLLGLSIILVTSGLFLLIRVIYSFRDIERGGLQVTANMGGRVLLNGEHIGNLPLRKTDQADTIPTGSYELRIEPEETSLSSYTARISINGGVLTAVDKTFLPGSLGSSYVLTLEKSSSPKPQIEITSIPSGALVTIDSVPSGATPYQSDSLSASEHEIEIQKEGFAKKTIRVRTVENHTLIVSVTLGTGDISSSQQFELPQEASPSAIPIPTTQETESVTILQTPNGFLRVRSGPSTSFAEVARVETGEIYNLLDEDAGWFEIQLDDAATGWISGQYATKN
jgi:hypothetical protein